MLAVTKGLFAVYILVSSGIGSRYDPGVFERAIRIHQAGGRLPQVPRYVDGYIALPSAEDMGKIVQVCFEDGECDLLFVSDCASKSDHQSETDLRSGYEWMLSGGIAGEVDHETAERHGASPALRKIWIYEMHYMRIVPK